MSTVVAARFDGRVIDVRYRGTSGEGYGADDGGR